MRKQKVIAKPHINSGFYDVIKKCILTPKSMMLELQQNYVTFYTEKHFNKIEIKSALEFLFKTKVLRVNVLNNKPYKKSFKGRPYFASGGKKVIAKLESLGGISEVFK